MDDYDAVADYIEYTDLVTPDEIYCPECDVWGDHESEDHG